MSSRRLYSRPVRKFLVFMKNDPSVVKFLMSLVLLTLIAPLDTSQPHGSIVLEAKLYTIYAMKRRKFKNYCSVFP